MLSKLGAGLRPRELFRRDVRRDVSHPSRIARRYPERELLSETDAVLGREFYDSCAVITVLFSLLCCCSYGRNRGKNGGKRERRKLGDAFLWSEWIVLYVYDRRLSINLKV